MHAFVFDGDSLGRTLNEISSGDYLETVNTATRFPNLLDMEARETPLGHLALKDFTTDVAVIKKSALEAGRPERGLVVLFDIHKNIDNNMLEAARKRVLVANMKSWESRPVVILTDLVDDWRMLYMSGETFHEETFETRARAEKLIEETMHEAARREYLDKLFPKPAG